MKASETVRFTIVDSLARQLRALENGNLFYSQHGGEFEIVKSKEQLYMLKEENKYTFYTRVS
jgi:hypothetical protein